MSILSTCNSQTIICYVRTIQMCTSHNLSFVKPKSELLGTEFKNVVDEITGAMLWLELHKGKTRMANKDHQKLGSTAACVICGVKVSTNLQSFPSLMIKIPQVSIDKF